MIRIERAHLPVSADSHPGMSGKNNEDSFAVSAYQLQDGNKAPVLLAVLSDGIGGHRAGEVASRIAVDLISQEVEKSDGSNPPQTLMTAIEKANEQIFTQSQSAEKKGMGATCSVAFIVDNRLYTATIGDSRIYLIRSGHIQQISKDHTWIQEALDSGLIQPDQVEGHPNAHVIRRYLGAPKSPKVDLRIRLTGRESDVEAESNQGTILAGGDKILLCSDGLTDLVKDHEILAALQTESMDAAIKSLIDLANQRGGHDNITIIVISMPKDYKPLTAPSSNRGWMIGCVILVIGAFLLIGIALGWMYKTNRLNRFIKLFIASPSVTVMPSSTTPTPTPTSTNTPTLTFTKSPTTTRTSTKKPTRTFTQTGTLTLTSDGSTAANSTTTITPTLNETEQLLTGTITTSPQTSSSVQPFASVTVGITQTRLVATSINTATNPLDNTPTTRVWATKATLEPPPSLPDPFNTTGT